MLQKNFLILRVVSSGGPSSLWNRSSRWVLLPIPAALLSEALSSVCRQPCQSPLQFSAQSEDCGGARRTFHRMLLLTVDWLRTIKSHHQYSVFLSNWQLLTARVSLHQKWKAFFSVFNQWWCYLVFYVHVMCIKLIFLETIGDFSFKYPVIVKAAKIR